MPGWLDPSATRVRWKEAQEEEARRREEEVREEFERELLELRWRVKSLRTDLLMLGLRHKYSPDQPRDERGRWTTVGEQSDTSDDANTESIESGAQQANVIRICMLGSHSISTDPHGNQSWWADYVCADGYTFRRFGTGGNIRAFRIDPR